MLAWSFVTRLSAALAPAGERERVSAEDGQAATEYAVLLTLIALTLVTVISTTLRSAIITTISNAAGSL
jgi:Flp pilus assembly pilin Flp